MKLAKCSYGYIDGYYMKCRSMAPLHDIKENKRKNSIFERINGSFVLFYKAWYKVQINILYFITFNLFFLC